MRLGSTFFRHEYGRLVASLARRVGTSHLEAAEDAAQHALLAAVETWPRRGEPENPSAWLFRVAQNELLGELRGRARRRRIDESRLRDEVPFADAPSVSLRGDVDDDLLRMLFVCCDDAIPVESQIVLALKILCGFDVREIAAHLFATEAGIYKRLARGREQLRVAHLTADDLAPNELERRLGAVHRILYLLFTEGYLSAHDDIAIRSDLCEEAIRLSELLARHEVGRTPETFALLALMHLHTARAPARCDGSGGLVLLDEQDRSKWDRARIASGLEWLARSAEGKTFSRYHAEAGIAAEHCLAPSLADTRWDRIIECYELLERVAPSPLHTLGRAVAIAERHGAEPALAILERSSPPFWLEGSYMWLAVLADLHGRTGNADVARRHRDDALASAPTAAIRKLLEHRFRRA